MQHGVYRIRNTQNHKCYIGSAAGKGGFAERWREHRKELRGNRHYNQHLQNAWNKYGADIFVFEPLLYCDPENCLMYEQIALDYYKLGYNICQVAGNTLGLRYSHQARTNCSRGQRGRKHPENVKAKISQANKNKKRSLSTRMKISKAKQGERHHNAKLTTSQIQEIRTLLKLGIRQHIIANKFGVTQQTISKIHTYKRWRYTS